jgi:hypothetical protein
MHPALTKRIEIPWPRVPWARVRRVSIILAIVTAIAVVLYVLSAPPIIKANMIRNGRNFHWPRFYAPLLMGLEDNSPLIHRPFRWYFNGVWGCGIIFFSDGPSIPE